MTSINDFTLPGIQGDENLLEGLAGRAILLVNVASQCGYTPQYSELESLHRELSQHGFSVVGAPCNQFGAQEPGSAAEIVQFCASRFNVSFPLSAKLEVNGPGRHPLYTWLTAPEQGFAGDIAWNFEKFLIDAAGQPVGRYPSAVSPRDNGLLQDIAAALPVAGDASP